MCPGSRSFPSSSTRLGAGAAGLPLCAALRALPATPAGCQSAVAGLTRLSAALGGEPAELVTYAKLEGWSQRYGSVLDSSRSDVFEQALLSNHGKRRNVTQVSPCSRYPRARGGMGGEWQGRRGGPSGGGGLMGTRLRRKQAGEGDGAGCSLHPRQG